MATITQIHNLRIEINDPTDIIRINSVADPAALPVTPIPQTAYYIISSGVYVTTEKTSGASPSDYKVSELFLSDISLGNIIDTWGTDKAISKSIIKICAKIASKLVLVKTKTGAESTEYIKLLDLYNYYKSLIGLLEEDEREKNNNSTGAYDSFEAPEIAGGNI